MEVTVGRTTRTSAGICDTCSRINIESLSSPEGYSHFYKQSDWESCPLCRKLFKQMGFDAMKDTRSNQIISKVILYGVPTLVSPC